jgi:hypothetical protein
MSRRSVQRLVLVQIPTLNGGADLPANARVSTVTDRTRDPKGRLVRWAKPGRERAVANQSIPRCVIVG